MTGLAGDATLAQAPHPWFSVALNVYNGENYIRQAIDSVLAQTFADWELVVWNDRSTDRTAEICLSYGDPRIRHILADAHAGLDRNLTARQARGRWLAFIDHDDVWLPDKLQSQYDLI